MQFALDQMNATVKAKDLPTLHVASSAKSRRSSPKRRRPGSRRSPKWRPSPRPASPAGSRTRRPWRAARLPERPAPLRAVAWPPGRPPYLSRAPPVRGSAVFAPHFMHRTMASGTLAPMSQERLIKKYANRRLYDASQSRHITLDDIRELIVKGEKIRVVEDKTGHDITRHILLQVIAEQEQFGRPILSDAGARVDHPLLRQPDAGFPRGLPREERRDVPAPAGIAAGADLEDRREHAARHGGRHDAAELEALAKMQECVLCAILPKREKAEGRRTRSVPDRAGQFPRQHRALALESPAIAARARRWPRSTWWHGISHATGFAPTAVAHGAAAARARSIARATRNSASPGRPGEQRAPHLQLEIAAVHPERQPAAAARRHAARSCLRDLRAPRSVFAPTSHRARSHEIRRQPSNATVRRRQIARNAMPRASRHDQCLHRRASAPCRDRIVMPAPRDLILAGRHGLERHEQVVQAAGTRQAGIDAPPAARTARRRAPASPPSATAAAATASAKCRSSGGIRARSDIRSFAPTPRCPPASAAAGHVAATNSIALRDAAELAGTRR